MKKFLETLISIWSLFSILNCFSLEVYCQTNHPPTVTLNDPVVNETRVDFSWSGSDQDGDIIMYSYKLDNNSWSGYTSNTSTYYTGVTLGSHIFYVRCKDVHELAGNTDQKSFSINLNHPPAIQNLRVSVSGSSATLTWEKSDPDGDAVTCYYSLDPGNYTSTAGTSVTLNDIPNGYHNFCVYPKDSKGLQGNNTCIQFTIDENHSPVIQNLRVSVSGSSATLTWEKSDPDGDAVTCYYSLDPGNYTSTSGTSVTLNHIPNGYHNFCVYPKDSKGLQGSNTCIQFTINDEKPVLVIHDIVPDLNNPSTNVNFENIPDFSKPGGSYEVRNSSEINSIDLSNYSCVMITNNKFKEINQPTKFANINLLLYEYQNSSITLPFSSKPLRYNPYSPRTLFTTPNPPQSPPVPLSVQLNINLSQLLINGAKIGTNFVEGLEGVNIIFDYEDLQKGNFIGLFQSLSSTGGIGPTLLVYGGSCVLTVEAAGGTCWLSLGVGTAWALSTLHELIANGAVSLEYHYIGNQLTTQEQMLWFDISQHRLHYAGSTIDCNYYFTYDDHLQYPVCRTSSENIFINPNNWIRLNAQGPFLLNSQGNLLNNGQMTIRAATPQEVEYMIHGDHANGLHKSTSEVIDLIDLDLKSNTFTYGNFSCQINDNTIDFQPELIIAHNNSNGLINVKANIDYCSTDFMIDSSDFITTIASVTFTPASPAQGTVDNPFHLQVQVGISTGQPGILQLMIGDSVSYQSIPGRQSTLATFNFDLLSSTQNLRTYPVNVQFRPYATAGPLLSSNLTDVIMTTNYQIDWTVTDIFDFEHDKIPTHFDLYDACPNPFNPTSTINYSVPKTSFVTIKVYNVLGRETAILVNEEKSAGNHKVEFNASNLSGGVYFYIMKAENYFSTKKLVLIK
ncbi:MAG: T9SS type A sorting domain-containing protein [Ignavibacteria bacterium]|nr:T9SS type A sorting domain-containing protein [Ignavibacteria bacterium]